MTLESSMEDRRGLEKEGIFLKETLLPPRPLSIRRPWIPERAKCRRVDLELIGCNYMHLTHIRTGLDEIVRL